MRIHTEAETSNTSEREKEFAAFISLHRNVSFSVRNKCLIISANKSSGPQLIKHHENELNKYFYVSLSRQGLASAGVVIVFIPFISN
jgi:hypothetical protein